MILLPKILTQSHCYISTHTKHQGLKAEHGWSFTLGEWCPQRVVSRSFFGAGGEATVRACDAHYGMFVWATEFSNVHSLFSFEEPRIVVNGEEWAVPRLFSSKESWSSIMGRSKTSWQC